MNGNKSVMSSLTAAVVMWCAVVMCADAGSSGYCKPKTYLHKAMQTDLNGRSCRGEVEIKSCWGYCLSFEISDWQFPYKESHHPVCVHGERRPASAKLKHCDPGVEPGTEHYHFVEAVNCRCQKCSSDDTSCDWLPPDTNLLGGLILKKELQEEMINDLD